MGRAHFSCHVTAFSQMANKEVINTCTFLQIVKYTPLKPKKMIKIVAGKYLREKKILCLQSGAMEQLQYLIFE